MPNSPGRSASNRKSSSPSDSHIVSGAFNTSQPSIKDGSIIKSSKASSSFPISGPLASNSGTAGFTIKDNNVVATSATLRSSMSVSKRGGFSNLASASKPSQPSSPPSTQQEPSIADGQRVDIETTRALDFNLKTGTKFELCFGVASFFIFLGLWIYLMVVNCYNTKEIVFYLKTLTMIGAITGLFIAIYNCFERTTTPGRGLTGCLYFLFVGVVGALNLIGAYLASLCPCRCSSSSNPFKSPGADLVIIVLEVCGSVCLLSTLLVVMMTR